MWLWTWVLNFYFHFATLNVSQIYLATIYGGLPSTIIDWAENLQDISVFEIHSKSCRSSCLESQIINIKLKKNQQKVPSPQKKLSASDWRTCGIFQHWDIYIYIYIKCSNVYMLLLFTAYPPFVIIVWSINLIILSEAKLDQFTISISLIIVIVNEN